MASIKMENTHPLQCQWNYKHCYELPKKSVPRPHKARYRNRHYGTERWRDLHFTKTMRNKTYDVTLVKTSFGKVAERYFAR